MAKGPPTKARRFFRLAGMTASVAGDAAKRKMKSWIGLKEDEEQRSQQDARTGARIAQTLGELKGAAMKVGQMAAAVADILPPEMADALRTLQREAPPAPFEQIAACIEAELGQPVQKAFATIDPEPFGAASIGQVHRARLHDGREVIVKTQYPGIEGAVDSDLAQLRLLAKAKGSFIDKKALDASFEEIRKRMKEELDYEHEATQARNYADMFAEDPTVIVPTIIEEFCSPKVITTSFEPSDPIDRLDELAYPQKVRDRLGERLYRWLWEQIFVHQRFHADPHPGNFGTRRNGALVVYDFGCIQSLSDDFVTRYRALLVSAFMEDYPGIEQALRALNLRNLDGPEVDFKYYKSWRDLVFGRFLSELDYDFANCGLHKALVEKAPGAIKYAKSFKPAPEMVFLDRSMFGHYGNLRSIKPKIRCAEILAEYVPEIQSAVDRAKQNP